MITFAAAADERGKVALYSRLAQKLVDHLGKDEWESGRHKSTQGGGQEVFTVERSS